MKELVEAVEALKASIIQQFGELPAEIADQFTTVEDIIREAAKPDPTETEEESK